MIRGNIQTFLGISLFSDNEIGPNLNGKIELILMRGEVACMCLIVSK